jgi:hypothetical protein
MTPVVALLLAAAPAHRPTVTGGLTDMVKLAVGLDEALGEFDQICLAHPFDAAAFERAVASSSWHYRRARDTFPELTGYDSVKGYVSRKGMGSPEGSLPQCNLDGATLRAYPPAEIATRIEARLSARGVSAVRRQVEDSLYWQWPLQEGKLARLYLLRHPGSDPRQLTLTLQKLRAERAGQ